MIYTHFIEPHVWRISYTLLHAPLSSSFHGSLVVSRSTTPQGAGVCLLSTGSLGEPAAGEKTKQAKENSQKQRTFPVGGYFTIYLILFDTP